MSTSPKPTAFMPPTIIPKNPRSQIRIETTTYQNEPRLDIREYRIFDGNTTFKPTKHGVTISVHNYADLLAAVQRHGKELPVRVVDIDTGIRWVIVQRQEDAAFHKKHVYTSFELARDAAPPDGYAIFKIKIRDNSVVKTLRVANRKNGKWVLVNLE
jgi:hypothetical protein